MIMAKNIKTTEKKEEEKERIFFHPIASYFLMFPWSLWIFRISGNHEGKRNT